MPRKPRAEKKPEPEFPRVVPVATLAHFSGLSERRIQQLAEQGIIPKPEERGEYKFEESLRALFAYMQELANGLPMQRAADLARSAKAEADTNERKRDMLFKRAIPLPLVQLAWGQIGAQLRSGIMGARLPKKVKVELIKRVRESLTSRDYFKLGKVEADELEDEGDE